MGDLIITFESEFDLASKTFKITAYEWIEDGDIGKMTNR
jgi:hypothetical protein